MQVFVLWHIHGVGDETDEKLIGVDSTEDLAHGAVSRLKVRPGLADHPGLRNVDSEGDEGFRIVPDPLDEDHWAEGFVTVR